MFTVRVTASQFRAITLAANHGEQAYGVPARLVLFSYEHEPRTVPGEVAEIIVDGKYKYIGKVAKVVAPDPKKTLPPAMIPKVILDAARKSGVPLERVLKDIEDADEDIMATWKVWVDAEPTQKPEVIDD